MMEPLMETLFNYIITTGVATLTQLFIFFGPGVILAIFNHLLANQVWNSAIAVMGWKGFAYTFALVGIPVHELGHALLHFLFGHSVTEIALFEPDNPNHSGHVTVAYNKNSIYQRMGVFFGAIGPILLGSFVLYLSATFLLGDWLFEPIKAIRISSESFSSISSLQQFGEQLYSATVVTLKLLFKGGNFEDWKFYLFIYLAFSVGSSITLSTTDIKNAFSGFMYIVFVLFVFNLFTIWIGNFATRYMGMVSQYFGTFYSIMVFTMALNVVALAIFSVIRLLFSVRR